MIARVARAVLALETALPVLGATGRATALGVPPLGGIDPEMPPKGGLQRPFCDVRTQNRKSVENLPYGGVTIVHALEKGRKPKRSRYGGGLVFSMKRSNASVEAAQSTSVPSIQCGNPSMHASGPVADAQEQQVADRLQVVGRVRRRGDADPQCLQRESPGPQDLFPLFPRSGGDLQIQMEELLGTTPEQIHSTRLYEALDQLLPHKEALETHLRKRLGELLELKCDLLLYDVTSTYFEGEMAGCPWPNAVIRATAAATGRRFASGWW